LSDESGEKSERWKNELFLVLVDERLDVLANVLEELRHDIGMELADDGQEAHDERRLVDCVLLGRELHG